MSNRRKIAVSPTDYKNGKKAGRRNPRTHDADLDQITAEEERTKDLKKDELEKAHTEYEQDITSLKEDWQETVQDLKSQGEVSEIEINRGKKERRLLSFEIFVFLIGEVLFTAGSLRYALGISQFEATIYAIAYPALSALALKGLVDSLEKRKKGESNLFVIFAFVIAQVAMIIVLSVLAIVRADMTVSFIKDINPLAIKIAFVGIVIGLTIILGLFLARREKIDIRISPIIKALKKKERIEKKLNDLETAFEDVKEQLAGLDDEFDRIIELRRTSYEAGFQKGFSRRLRREKFWNIVTFRRKNKP
ncbi:hypothetical protein B1H10_00340 [candidate division KSB1 bacterium 4484_188]|nr:MAG: hypothetical protein B1H10_00340 [candidate division KSB1 bacterium 4484_188]